MKKMKVAIAQKERHYGINKIDKICSFKLDLLNVDIEPQPLRQYKTKRVHKTVRNRRNGYNDAYPTI